MVCLHFFSILLVILFKMAPRHSAEMLSSASGCKDVPLENVLGKLVQALVIVLLALSSILMNQQYILNKGSFNRNTKQGYILIS